MCDRKIGIFDCCSVVEGDCLQLMRELPDGCVDAVITDPPYGINLVPQRRITKAIVGDTVEEAAKLYSYVARESARIMRDDRVAFFFGGWSECHWNKPLIAQYLRVKACIVWVKNRFGIGYYTRPQHEFIWYCWKGTPEKPEIAPSDVWEFDAEFAPVHSCQKPELLMEELVNFGGGETVIDPFAGSGTTLVAAKKLGRHYLGFEISPIYVDLARKRLAAIDAQPSLFEQKPEQLGLLPEGEGTSSASRARVRGSDDRRPQDSTEREHLSSSENTESGGCDAPR
jgi:DNA modification methylase